jgi:hypothetical protein
MWILTRYSRYFLKFAVEFEANKILKHQSCLTKLYCKRINAFLIDQWDCIIEQSSDPRAIFANLQPWRQNAQWTRLITMCNRHRFSGGVRGGCAPPRNDLHPPKAFGTPANYIYFDLIVSYLIILTTKFVKLPILWSQISPCRPRKQILLNFFLGLSGRCHHAPAKASSSTPPRTKIWKSVSDV